MGFVDEEDIPIAPNQTTLDLMVPTFSEPTAYPRPGYYNAVIAFNNGVCLSDSLMTYPFTMTMQYPSWLVEQHFNDVMALLDAPYNGGYTWTPSNGTRTTHRSSVRPSPTCIYRPD